MKEISQKLETVFRQIQQERMLDVPVCNPALQVEAVGFRHWEKFYLGVMITPWFMNLMLLPVDQDAEGNGSWNAQQGSKQIHVFPSGRYEFIHGEEEGVGRYQVCSLFSPMQDFKSHQAAVDTATLILAELMKVCNQNRDTISIEAKSESSESESAKWQKPISRRDFLRGSRSGER